MSANDHARILSNSGPGALHQADDSRPPSNIPETANYKLSNKKSTQATSISEPRVSVILPSSGISRGPSPGSGVGQIYAEKTRGQSPKRVQHRQSTARTQGRKSSSKNDASAPMQNGTLHISMAESTNSPTSTKRKKSGLGTVIRRIFGRRSVKNRISLPAPVEHHNNVSAVWDRGRPRRMRADIFKGSAHIHYLAVGPQVPTCRVGARSRPSAFECSRLPFAFRFERTKGFPCQ